MNDNEQPIGEMTEAHEIAAAGLRIIEAAAAFTEAERVQDGQIADQIEMLEAKNTRLQKVVDQAIECGDIRIEKEMLCHPGYQGEDYADPAAQYPELYEELERRGR